MSTRKILNNCCCYATNNTSVYNFKKWCTVLGSFSIVFPSGLIWYWGNMSVYVLSYVVKYIPPRYGVESSWVMSLTMLAACVGILTSAVMCKFFGKRLTTLFGMIVSVMALVGAYFAIQTSFISLVVTIGLVLSTGAFALEATASLYAIEWCQDDVGIVSAIVQSGFTVGAICIDYAVTFYLNPQNLQPDKQIGRSMYFSQDEVVDKVPSMFLIVALIIFVATSIGVLLVREPPETKTELRDPTSEPAELVERSFPVQCEESILTVESGEREGDTSQPSMITDPSELSPGQVVRTYTLYFYCFFFVMSEVPLIVVCTYYKEYGLVYIKDDRFLTNLSTVWLVVITTTRIFWGLALDRWGLKTSLIALFSSCAIISFCVYFSPLIGKWHYVVMVMIFGGVASPLYVVFSYAAVKAFGKRYFIFNFGLVMLPTLLSNLALPPIFHDFSTNLGWFYVFCFSSCCNFLGLIVVILFYHDKQQ